MISVPKKEEMKADIETLMQAAAEKSFRVTDDKKE